jgi:hypothetical protein
MHYIGIFVRYNERNERNERDEQVAASMFGRGSRPARAAG